MKTIVLILFCTVIANTYVIGQNTNENMFNTIITVKLSDAGSDQIDNITAVVGKSMDLNIEYICREAGIIVFRLLSSSVSEKGDAQSFIRTIINKTANPPPLKILDISIEKIEEVTKC